MTIEIDPAHNRPSPFVVKGQVRQPDGRPFVRGLVRAFDRDLRSEQLLGECHTDRGGAYRIDYGTHHFRVVEKGAADLLVKLLDADGSMLVASSILFNAPAEATVNLTLSLERQPSLTLWRLAP
jgi:hypothetical protein